jgi:hypothetical protein
MHQAGALDSVVKDKFGDLSTAKAPANAIEPEMAGGRGNKTPSHGSPQSHPSGRDESFAQTASTGGRPNDGQSVGSASAGGSEFQAPKTFIDRHQNLSNGLYRLDADGMRPHIDGTTKSGKSQFLSFVDQDRVTLDAAAYADRFELWDGNKAKIFVKNGPIGIRSENGELTSWINVYRTKSGFVHATPGNAP